VTKWGLLLLVGALVVGLTSRVPARTAYRAVACSTGVILCLVWLTSWR
jgi:hypothetical protein